MSTPLLKTRVDVPPLARSLDYAQDRSGRRGHHYVRRFRPGGLGKTMPPSEWGADFGLMSANDQVDDPGSV